MTTAGPTPTPSPAHNLAAYAISDERLTEGTPVRATITLLSENEIALSRRQLHRGVCQRLQRSFADKLTQAPYRETALFGLLEHQVPIEITLNRLKNAFNPFSLLVIMSHKSENSIARFVVILPDVEEVFTLTSRKQYGADAKKPALILRVLDFFNA